MMLQQRVMIVDGNNVYARAWFTINNQNVSKDGLKQTIALFKSMIVNLRKNYISDLVIICWDGGKDPERLKLLPEYKKREEKSSNYYDGIKILYKEIEQVHEQYVQLQINNVEADDLIGTLASYYSLLDYVVIVASDDKDMLQTINQNTFIVHSKKGIIDAFKFKEMYSFLPIHFVDYLAILGDKIDNIPGVKGIGEIGAQELVHNFNTIEQMYQNIDKVPAKYCAKLKSAQQEAFLSKQMILLKTINIPTSKLIEPKVNEVSARSQYDEVEYII